jgi:1,6-anhydro-N-acetylmuramate kinase
MEEWVEVCYNERMGKNEMLVAGVMSGTSGDGVDVALARVADRAGRVHGELLAHATFPLEKLVRAEILRVAEGKAVTAGAISQLNFRLGGVFAEAVIAGCKKFRVALSQVDLIGSHGQTVFHCGKAIPFLGRDIASTLQIGEGAVIAARTGVNVVTDFRTADMAVGGHGAPLVPFVDWILFGDARKNRVALNLGGIGNVTVLPAGGIVGSSGRGGDDSLPGSLHSEPQSARLSGRDDKRRERQQKSPPFSKGAQSGAPGETLGAQSLRNSGHARLTAPRGTAGVFAFDTGPGNMVIDALVAHFTRGRKRFDEDGRIARQGQTNERVLAELMKDEYLLMRPPKTTGREYFGAAYVERLLKIGKRFGASADDLVRTATIFTAMTVVDALKRFVMPRVRIDELIVSGGGAHNPVIMGQLKEALAPVAVRGSAELGVDVDAKEAFAFALLAYETWHRRPGNLPAATGARRAAILGKISYA